MLPRVLTALVTPFTSDKKTVDYESFKRVIETSLFNDTGVVLFGTTGECPTIERSEKLEILNIVKNNYGIHMNSIAIGVGGYDTAKCIADMTEAFLMGFRHFMVTVPYYSKPTQDGIIEHYKAISSALTKMSETAKLSGDVAYDADIIIYNIPGRTGVNCLPKTVKEIFDNCLNVKYIKEASGDLAQMMQLRILVPKLVLYSGDDGLIVPIMSIGGYGVISVLSNAFPISVNTMVHLCNQNKYDTAFFLHSEFSKLIKLLFVETNPTPIKYVLYKSGYIAHPTVRLPLLEIKSSELKDEISDEIKCLIEKKYA